VCSEADLTAAVAACFGSTGSAAACTSWQQANAACAACAVPPNTADGGPPPANGAILCVDSVGECFVNVAGCIQIVDGNSTCASAIEELNLCEFQACDSAACVTELQSTSSAEQTDYQNCESAADNLACMSQITTANTACGGGDSADGGALQQCQAQTVAEVSGVIYKICGNGQ
jgi:hypothetical protein